MARHPKSLLWTTHAGSETGHAVADTLFGDSNPSGRLTQTWYRSDSDLPPNAFNYDIISSKQTYLYYQGKPLFPFGHGLSYTAFNYSNLRLGSTSVGASGAVKVTVDVTNTGSRAGDEVVQLYTHQRISRDKVPGRQLRAFQRVSLQPGETKTVRFALRTSDLAHWDVTRNRWVVESSVYDLLVGSSSVDIRQRGSVHVHGETIPPRDLSRATQARNFDDYSNLDLVDTTKTRGTSVASTDSAGWAEYAKAVVGPRTFTARVAKASAGTGSIQVRLDSPDGPLLGAATIDSTGSRYAYQKATTSLRAVRGVRDVYLVMSPGLRLSRFSVS